MDLKITGTPTYTYKAQLLSVHDGDTITVSVDCGFHIAFETALRFYGINAPELTTQAGKDARDYLKSVITPNLTIQTFKNPSDKYGRWLAVILDDKGNSLNQQMIDTGHAVAYYG